MLNGVVEVRPSRTSRIALTGIGRSRLVVFSLVLSLLPIGAAAEASSEGSGLRQLFWASVFTFAGYQILMNWRLARDVLSRVNPWLIVLLLYVGATVIWSPDVGTSFRRYVQVVGVFVVAWAANCVTGRTSILPGSMARASLYGTLLSLAVTAAFFDFAFSDKGYRAFLATKNLMGQFAVIVVMSAVFMFLARPSRNRWWNALAFGVLNVLAAPFAGETRNRPAYALYAFLFAFGVAALVLSRSATAILASGATLLLVTLLSLARARNEVLRVLYVGAVLVAMLGLFLWLLIEGLPSANQVGSLFTDTTGRDMTLTGRTYLWQLMWGQIERHPWFGVGYGGFWLGLTGDAGQIAYLVKWGYPGQAHNGYIDVLNEIGFVGMALLLITLAVHVRRVFLLIAQAPGLGYLHLAIVLFAMMLNFTEATLLRTTSMWWMLVLISMIEVDRRVGTEFLGDERRATISGAPA
jgi:exopolysaccharide production protein ExoQ